MRQTRPKGKPDQKPETWDSNPGLEYFNSCNHFYCPLKMCLKPTILTKPPPTQVDLELTIWLRLPDFTRWT